MKHFFSGLPCLLAALLLSISSHAQVGGFTGGQGNGRQMPRMGKMYGKVVDSKSGKPVDVASVSLLQTRNGKKVLVQGAVTEANGEFSLENLPMMGQFELVITALGYKDYKQNVAFDMSALMKAGGSMRNMQSGDAGSIPEGATAALDAINKDLGNIHLEQSAKSLDEVTVTARVPTFSLQGEKKVFNAEQNLTSQGGTAADVMKNVPGVLVDADNKVTIRNSSPQLLIDGRQSPLQLDQIPADAIESVEVITNPSAKYDAEGGTGGVLNIVLKKNRKRGYNGSLRAGADSRGGGNLGGDFNVRSGKFNVSFNGHSNLNRSYTTATTERTDFYSSPDVRSYQDDVNKNRGAFVFGRLGLDYFITNRTTLSISGMKVHGEFRPDDHIDVTTDSLFSAGIRSTWAQRSTDGKNSFDMNGAQFGMKHIFPRAGEEWTIDASANLGTNANDSRYTTTAYSDAAHINQVGLSDRQRTAGDGKNNFYTIQSDYTHPFADKNKLDMGVKATVRQVESNIHNYYYDSFESQYVEIANPNSDYKNTDAVYAAYASYSGNLNPNNSFQVGLRAESSQYTGTLSKRDTSFSIQYPVSLFPSIFYTRKMSHDQQIQFSYRRGVNRPNFFQLLPFTDYTDPLNIRQGNPALQPEFTNSVELSYMKNFTKSNYILFSLYERHSDNLITSYQSLGANPFTGENAIITSYINANSSDKYGVEVTSGWDLYKWWNVNANVNVYNGQLTSGTGTNSSYFSGFGKLNNQFRLAKGWSAQLSGAYQSRTNLLPDQKNDFGGRGGMGGGGRGMFGPQSSSNAQGYLDAQWYADVSIRKSFLKNDAASVSLSVNDIFGTRKFIQHSENDLFVQDYSRLVNPTMFRLNFNWRFGKVDTDLFRRKNLKGQMEGMQDATQGVGM
jgi:outer membrane receptor protein involved in Fe transport